MQLRFHFCPVSSLSLVWLGCTEAVYLVMYSAVILNGDLRNPAIKPHHKMRRDVFVRNNRGIPALASVSEQCLFQVYDQVKEYGLPVRGWEGEEEARHSAGLMESLVGPGAATALRSALCSVTVLGQSVSAGASNLFSSLRQHLAS